MSRKSINVRTHYRIVGSDYSAQEPRMTTFLSGDKTMYQAYNEGKDLYAMIAQSAFNNKYEDNLEFWPEGTELEVDGHKVIAGHKTHLNKDGKARRAVGKVLNLSATYGMSGATAGARLGKSKEEGEELLNSFFTGFPGVKTAIDQSKAFLKENGYVEDFVGRRRRLDDINMDPYKAQVKNKTSDDANFNPFINCQDRKNPNDPEAVWLQILDQYILLSNASRASAALAERKKPEGMRIASKCQYEDKNEISNQTFDKLFRIAMKPGYMSNQPWSTSGKRTCAQRIADDAKAVSDLLLSGEYMSFDRETKQRMRIDVASEIPEIAAAIKRYKAKYGTTVRSEIPQEPTILSAWTGKIAQASRQCFNARIQGCLSPETTVITKEFGLKHIGELANSYCTLWDGNDWTNALVLPSGKKQKCILTTDTDQQIVCSPDHRFMTSLSREFTPLKELKPGDCVYVESDGTSAATIKSIEVIDEYIDMFDACNTERGYFVANGFVTHNSAASLTKMAMVDIFNDPKLREWDANLIITVHDEVLVECREEYANLVEQRLPEIMVAAAKKAGDDVPQACDPYNVTRWYSDTMAATVMDEFKKLEQKGLSREEAMKKVISNHSEIPEAALEKTIETGCDLDF